MNEQATINILWFLDLPEMRIDSYYPDLKERMYRRWAASELLASLSEHPDSQPEVIIDKLGLLMLQYAHTASTETCRYVFQIAFDTIETIRHYLFGQEGY